MGGTGWKRALFFSRCFRSLPEGTPGGPSSLSGRLAPEPEVEKKSMVRSLANFLGPQIQDYHLILTFNAVHIGHDVGVRVLFQVFELSKVLVV
jgi:hypothetical protein